MIQRFVALVTLLALSFVPTLAQTATDRTGFGYIEAQTLNTQPQANLWLQDTKPGEKIGWYVWGQTSRMYSQIYGGATYQLTKTLQIGGGAGVEQVSAPWRVGGFAYYSRGKYSVLAIGEKGGGGGWYLAQAGYKANSRVQFSLHSQRFVGTGPRLDVTLGKGFTLWGGYYVQPNRNTTIVSLKKTFSF